MGDNFFMEGKRVFAHHGTALPLATTKLTPPMHLQGDPLLRLRTYH